MTIVRYRTLIYIITGIILAAAVGAIVTYGLPRAIDFTGGSLMQIEYPEGRPVLAEIEAQVAPLEFGAVSIRETGEKSVTIRARTLTAEEHTQLINVLSQKYQIQELAHTSVGPSLGNEFAAKALWALLAVAVAIALYVAIAFRKVSHPVPSWVYGVVAILMLAHDLIVPAGFYAVLGSLTGAEVDALFVTALLALLGYSVNDTIVVFDRIREHLAHNEKEGIKESFEDTVGKSISETLTRSLNTSLTTALGLGAVAFFGAEVTRNFALVMLVGVIAGTYSSVLLAAPLLIPLARWYVKK